MSIGFPAAYTLPFSKPQVIKPRPALQASDEADAAPKQGRRKDSSPA